MSPLFAQGSIITYQVDYQVLFNYLIHGSMPHRKPCSSSRKMVQFALNGSLSEGYLGTEYFITVMLWNMMALTDLLLKLYVCGEIPENVWFNQIFQWPL